MISLMLSSTGSPRLRGIHVLSHAAAVPLTEPGHLTLPEVTDLKPQYR